MNLRHSGSRVPSNISNSEWAVDPNGFGLLVLACPAARALGKVLDLLEAAGCEDMISVQATHEENAQASLMGTEMRAVQRV